MLWGVNVLSCIKNILCCVGLLFAFSTVAATGSAAELTTAPQKNIRMNIFILETMELPLIQQSSEVFQAELSQLMPNVDFNFITANAQGSMDKATSLITQQLTNGPPLSLILSIATVATKALVATAELHNIPMQFMVVSDPVAAGVVDAMEQTSTLNITGIAHVIATKTKLHLLSQMTTTPLRIGLIYSDYPSSMLAHKEITRSALDFPQFTFIPIKFKLATGQGAQTTNQSRIVTQLQRFRDKIDVLWIAVGPAAHDLELYDVIQNSVLTPFIFSEDERVVAQGAMFGVMCDEYIIGRSTAIISHKILQGMPPNAYPISQSKRFIVALNVTTALDLNIVFPSSVLSLAKNHVYH